MNNLFSELCLSTKIFLSKQFSSLESQGPFNFQVYREYNTRKSYLFSQAGIKENVLELANVIHCFL